MPTSLTALAIFVLLGVPGFVYMELRPAPRQEGSTSELRRTLETVFFGLACGVGGLLISLRAQTEEWKSISDDLPISRPGGITSFLQTHAPAVGLVALSGALLVALLLAGLMNFLRGLRPSEDASGLLGRLADALNWLEDNELIRGFLMVVLAVAGIVCVIRVAG